MSRNDQQLARLAALAALPLLGLRSRLQGPRRPKDGAPSCDHLSTDLLRAARDDVPALVVRLGSHEDGLSASEVALRLERSGPNEVGHEKPLSWPLHLWRCYSNPFNLLLSVLMTVS